MEVKRKEPRRGSNYCEVLLPDEEAEEDVPRQADGSRPVWRRGADAEAIMQLLAAEASRAPASRETVEVGKVSVEELQQLTRPFKQRSDPATKRERRAAPLRRASAARVAPRRRVAPDAPLTGKLVRAESVDVISMDPTLMGCGARQTRSHTLTEQLPLSSLAGRSVPASSPPVERMRTAAAAVTESDELVYTCSEDDFFTAGESTAEGSREVSCDDGSAPSSRRGSEGYDGLPCIPELSIPPLTSAGDLPSAQATGEEASADTSATAASQVARSGDESSGKDASPGEESAALRGKPKKRNRTRQRVALAADGSPARRPSRPESEDLMKAAKRVQQEMKLVKNRGGSKTLLGMLRSSTSENLLAMSESSHDQIERPEPSAKDVSRAYALLTEAMATISRLRSEEANATKRIAALEQKEKELLTSCDTLAVNTSPGPSRRKKKGRDLVVDVNDIVIGARLGSGGSGAVVHTCIVDGWVCAMKQMNTKSKADLDAFEREMSILYRLPAHPNIVKYLFHKTIQGKLCLFMTRHETTLQAEIDSRKKSSPHEPFTREMVIHIAQQVISGIAFLHKHQILHRDIKCDNVFCTFGATGELEHAVIADFDTAKKTGVTNVPQSTIGTVGFMAPEVFSLDNESGYSYGVDVFSFGMVLYSMLTLEEPYFDIENRFNVYKAILANQPPLLGAAEVEKYGEGLVQLHRRCVQLDPNQRPTTAQVTDALTVLVDHR